MKKAPFVSVFFCLIISAAFFTPTIYAESLSTNGDFESTIENWELVPGSSKEFQFQSSDSQAQSGSKSLKLSNPKERSYGIQQTITNIIPDQYYQLSGWVKFPESEKSGDIFFRIAWYQSADGSGKQTQTQDSESINNATDWQHVTVTAQAPPDTKSAKVRILLAGPNSQAHIDNIQFAPVQVTPTPEPTSTFTPSPKPTHTPTPSPTPRPRSTSETLLQTASSDPTAEVVLSQDETISQNPPTRSTGTLKNQMPIQPSDSSGEILGAEDSQATTIHKSNPAGIFIISGGIIISSITGYLYYQRYQKATMEEVT